MQRTDIEVGNEKQDASALRVGIVVSTYYEEINAALLEGALGVLREWGVPESAIVIRRVPGGFEIPYGCQWILEHDTVDTLITLGCIVKGETDHDQHIAGAVVQGLSRLMLKYGKPISLGVITVNTMEQAVVRSTGENNKGKEAARAALQMALFN